MKVSLVTTVKNEREKIENFLDSVLKQTKKPDEFIIVDGGSTDGTVEKIKKYAKKYRWIKLIEAPGANIAKGRNICVKNAKNKIIAMTDVDILDKDWLKNITKPFKNNIDVVAGVWKPLYKNDFEYFEGLIICPKIEEIKTPSRMSARSFAFKKKCWERVGGYPEESYTGEDTSFNIKLIKNKFRLGFAKNAIVYWRMRKSWKYFAKLFYLYGVGDRKTGNIFKMKLNFFMIVGFLAYLIVLFVCILSNIKLFLVLATLGFTYFFKEGLKLFIKTKKIKALFYGTLLFFVKRISYILGVIIGK